MRAVRIVGARMWDDREAMRFGEVADFYTGSHATDPLQIGLKNIDQAVACCKGERMD